MGVLKKSNSVSFNLFDDILGVSSISNKFGCEIGLFVGFSKLGALGLLFLLSLLGVLEEEEDDDDEIFFFILENFSFSSNSSLSSTFFFFSCSSNSVSCSSSSLKNYFLKKINS